MLKTAWRRGGKTGDEALDSVVNNFLLMQSGVALALDDLTLFDVDVLPLVYISYKNFEVERVNKREENLYKVLTRLFKSAYGKR